jgi:spermidine synthase
LSDPIEEGPSFQLFTKEYFERVQRVLAPGGYFVLQAGPVAPIELTLHARLVSTMKAVFPNVHSYSAYTPSYGSPWGFIIGSAEEIVTLPDPATIDQLLSEKTTGGFRLIDGMSLLGILQTPAYVRKAIAAETEVYTLKEPPKFFGKGALG